MRVHPDGAHETQKGESLSPADPRGEPGEGGREKSQGK